MAHTLKLKYGSPADWKTINLTDAKHAIVDYTPGTAADDADDITESGVFRVAGSSVADLQTEIRRIENVLRMAGAYDLDPTGPGQVILTAQWSEDGETWESPVYEGRLELPAGTLGVDWANRELEVTLIWRRAPYWERYLAVPISNDNGSNKIDGLPISNRNDGSGTSPAKNINYADILRPGDVPGDLPAPAVIEITNNMGMANFFICHNYKSLPGSLAYQVEAETGTDDILYAGASGGKYHSFTVPAGLTGINIDFPTTSASLRSIQWGAWLRILISAQFDGTVRVRPYLAINGFKYYGPGSILTNETGFKIYDLGAMLLPASGIYQEVSQVGEGIIGFGINLVSTLGISLDLDYVQFAPADNFALAKMNTVDLAADNITYRARLDCHERLAVGYVRVDMTGYFLESAHTLGTLYGSILLEPSTAQRLVIKMSGLDGTDLMTFLETVTLHCWARKKTL